MSEVRDITRIPDLHNNPRSETSWFGSDWRCTQENSRKQICITQSFELSPTAEYYRMFYQCRHVAPDLQKEMHEQQKY
ncbi:hypothetical protein TNCV_3178501 [Trichonephila clavipes]|nr:hypothetical protein TNCV_3178501 [Trichonephila clavipes]